MMCCPAPSALLFALAALAAAARASHFPTSTEGEINPGASPLCDDVWSGSSTPSFADPTIVGTVAAMDAAGAFSGSPGVAVLGGTTPFGAYVQATIASTFNQLGGEKGPYDDLCAGTFQINLLEDPSTSPLAALFNSDIQAYAADTSAGATVGSFSSFEYYLASKEFFERRLCPCYQQLPPALLEPLNCLPSPTAAFTLSESWFVCNIADAAEIYENDVELASLVPSTPDSSALAEWKGCVSGYTFIFGGYNCASDQFYGAAVDALGLAPSTWQPGPASATWLETTYQNCLPCGTTEEQTAIVDVFVAPANVELAVAFAAALDSVCSFHRCTAAPTEAPTGSGEVTDAPETNTNPTYAAEAETSSNVVAMQTDVACADYGSLSDEEKAQLKDGAATQFSGATSISAGVAVSCEGAASAAGRRLARARRQQASNNLIFFFIVPDDTTAAEIDAAVAAVVAAVNDGTFEVAAGSITIDASSIQTQAIGQVNVIAESLVDAQIRSADDICEAAGCCGGMGKGGGKGGGKAAKAAKAAKSPKEARAAGADSPTKAAKVAGATKSPKSAKSPKTTAARHARQADTTKAPKSVKSAKEARVAGDSPVKAAKVPKTTESAAEIEAREAICALCTCSVGKGKGKGKGKKTDSKAKKSKSGALAAFGPAAKTAGTIFAPLALIAAAAVVITGRRSRDQLIELKMEAPDATESCQLLTDDHTV